MATGTDWASELAAIQEQLSAVLRSQERVAHAVAELKADIAPVLVSWPRRPSRQNSHGAEPRPGAAADGQDGLDSGRPARGADISEPAAADPTDSTASSESVSGAAKECAVGRHLGSASFSDSDISEPAAAKPTDSAESSESASEAAIDFTVGKRRRSDEDLRRSKTRRVTRFRTLLSHNAKRALLGRLSLQSHGMLSWGRMCQNRPHLFETRLDAVFSLVILLSTLVMAMEMDADRTPGRAFEVWTVLAIVFSVLFWTELCCRLWLHGFRRYFFGKDWLPNVLDAALVVTDTVQVVSVVSLGGEAMRGIPFASLFRVFRIFRIARVIRVLRSPLFKDLLTIVNGLRGGLVTLSWSFVPFFLVLFTASLVCRESVGRGSEANVGPYFDTVPRALLTMIRCSFGDFTSATGVPIIEHMVSAYGLSWGFVYGVFVFFLSVGVFNVIAAVFLDSTLTATASLQRAKLQMRLADKELWYSRAFVLVRHLLPHTNCEQLPDGAELSEHAEKIMAAEIWRHEITKLARKEEIAQVLRDLDIDPRDDHILGDVLDSNHTGYITMLDFVNGLQRLRGGDLRRSDVLSVDFMVRTLQEKVDEMSRTLRRALEARAPQTHFI